MRAYKIRIIVVTTTEWGDVREKYYLKFLSMDNASAIMRAAKEAKTQGYKNIVEMKILMSIPCDTRTKEFYVNNLAKLYNQDMERMRPKNEKSDKEKN